MTGSSQYERNTGKAAALVAALSLALLFISHITTGKELFAAWQTDEYSHGIIIPFLALLIAWHRLTDARPKIQPSSWGVAVLALGGMLLMVGLLAAFEAAAEYSFILSLVGLSLA